jgi:hypothetical protein
MADKKISQLTAATIPLAGTEVLPLVQTSTKKIAASDLMKRTFDDFGINTNPSAWSASFTGVDVGTGGSMMADATSFYQGANWFWSGAAYVYKNTGPAIQSIYTGSGEYIIANAPSGTAGNAASFTNRLYMYSEGSLGMLTGNLVIGTAGKGIDFSANPNPAGMTSELLNDYEEGTWTPTVASSVGSITSSTSTGKYTKIGRQVTIELSVSVTNNGTGADSIRIGGLPFTAESTGYAGAGFNTSSGEALAVGFAATNTLVVYKYNVLYPVTTGQGFAIVVTYFV